MAAEIKVKGIEEISRQLALLGQDAGGIAARALYVGAGIVADAVTDAAMNLETEDFRFASEANPRKCSPDEKRLLIRHIAGIAKFEKSGAEVNTAVGLVNAGYGHIKGKQVPVPLIARSINSGTSFRVKQPFFRQAVTKARSGASAAIANEVGKAVEGLLKQGGNLDA